ncbi:hypothetical protein pb186bvf_013887 [Paramecium bursaria]
MSRPGQGLKEIVLEMPQRSQGDIYESQIHRIKTYKYNPQERNVRFSQDILACVFDTDTRVSIISETKLKLGIPQSPQTGSILKRHDDIPD